MGHIFGKPKPKKPVVTEQDKAVLQLKQQRDSVKKYQKRIIKEMEKEREMARQLLKDNKKDKALLLLKKKKYMESILEKTDNQLITLEKLVSDIEFSQIQTEVFEGLKTGNESLKQLHSILSIDKIEQIMDDTKEGIEKQREIDDLLMGLNIDTSEEGLEEELEQLLSQPLPDLPEVPQDDFRDMERSMPKSMPRERPVKEAKKHKAAKEALLES